MANPNITGLTFARLRDAHGFLGHAMSASLSVRHCAFVEVYVDPFIGLAQGRIVSISRGSPPPKQR
jgi:hypothetical protein